MNSCASCVSNFLKRLDLLDGVGHLFSRMTDLASSALAVAEHITVRQTAKGISHSDGIVIADSTREPAQQKIRHASTVLSYSSVSLNLVRLFCEAFTLPVVWYKTATTRRDQGVQIADTLVNTAFVTHRAFAVTQYFLTNKAMPKSLGHAANGILGFGVVGSFSIACYKWVYEVGGDSPNRRILEIVRSAMDLICWIVETVRYSLRNTTLDLVSVAVGLVDAVVWISSMLLCDSFQEGSKPAITL